MVPWREQASAERSKVRPRAAWRQYVDLDGLFAFLMFAPMVFVLQLGMFGAAAFVGAAALYAAIRLRRTGEILISRSFLLLPAIFACFSFLWSEAPGESFKYGLELGVTLVAALFLTAARRPDMVLRGMALAFLLHGVVSLALGGTVAVGNFGQTAFSGLSGSKNLVADIASTGLVITLGAAWLAARKRAWLWTALLVIGTAVEIWIVIQARSAGAMLSLGVGVATLFALASLLRAPAALRGFITFVVAIVVSAVAVYYRAIAEALVQVAAAVFDKDASLTGRTHLWDRAFELVRERPVLGRGFYAFWQQGNPDAEGLWRYAGITDRTGFTFHNSLIEILVQLGWAGVLLFGAVLIAGIICFAIRFVRAPSLVLCVWGAVLCYELVRMPIESIGFAPFFFSTVLITGALAMAFSPRERSAPAQIVEVVDIPAENVIHFREFAAARRG